MRPTIKTIVFAALLPTALQADGSRGNSNGGAANSRRGLDVIGLTSDGRLISFNEYAPGHATNLGSVFGLMGGDTALVGIDYRVQDGKLYGVGNAGGVYVFNSGMTATLVNRLTVALTGTSFGVDFNPAADRLRIISNDGQNLRHNVNPGGVTLVDGMLNYTPGTAATGNTGAAYTNNDLDPATATTLYNIDSTLDQVVLQSPPNNGSLAATGKLGTDTTASVGFDIHSRVWDGTTTSVKGLACLTAVDGFIRLCSINLATGKATLRGNFQAWNRVTDIAIPLGQP